MGRFYTSNKEIEEMTTDNLEKFARQKRDGEWYMLVFIVMLGALCISCAMMSSVMSDNYGDRIDALKSTSITLGQHICEAGYGESFTNFKVLENGKIQLWCEETYTTIRG